MTTLECNCLYNLLNHVNQLMKLSIIIPAHNEEKTIAQVLEQVLKVDLDGWEKEVVVVDDGSSDGTGTILEKICSVPIYGHSGSPINRHATLISHPTNLGKGAAIKSALVKATGDYVIIQDADLEYNPGDIVNLLSFIPDDGKHRIAIFGKRGYKAYPERGFHYVIGAWLLTTFYNLLYGQQLTDLYTGYKLIPTRIFKELNIESNGFEFEAEVACKLVKKNVIIKEVEISYLPRNKAQGKHIRFVDAVKGFWTIVKIRLFKN